MDAADQKTSEFERRGSRRPSVRVSVNDDDVYLSTVADGFRPQLPVVTPSLGNSSRSSYTSDETELTPPTPRHAQPASVVLPLPVPTARPSSIAKPPSSESDSFALRHDGGMGPITISAAAAAAATPPTAAIHNFATGSAATPASGLPSRGGSISTTRSGVLPPLRQESPYQGPSGPSHPYGMYPQGVRLTRTLSMATSSTSEPAVAATGEQPYAGPRGPAHPYGMYSQNTILAQNTGSDAGTSTAAGGMGMAVAANVGFPGLSGDQYRRRLGPDGEEIADMIGPDGHTEQLPPYTRYPDEQYARKVRDAESTEGSSADPATVGAGPAVVARSTATLAGGSTATSMPVVAANVPPPPIQPIAGAGGMGLAARNPEFDSLDDLHSPRSRHSSRSFNSDMSHHEINTAAAVVSEKRSSKNWQQTGRKRLWGIVPCWAVALTATVLMLMGVILGAVIGTFLTKQHRKPPGGDSDSKPQTTFIYDAQPIPVPQGLPDLPIGTFSMPVMPQRAPNLCFADTTQANAWTCNIIFGGFAAAMTMTVSRNGGSDSTPYSIYMAANASLALGNGMYGYGTQPPLLPPDGKPMIMVNDTLEPSRGPAWFKFVEFNKTVVLPESMLSPTPSGSASRHRRGSGGESPSSSPTSRPPPDFKYKMMAKPGDKPWVCTWSDTVLEIFIYPEQNTSYRGPPPERSSINANSNGNSPSRTAGMFPSPTGSPESDETGNHQRGNGGAAATTSSGPTSTFPAEPEYTPFNPPYPRIVKLEERRRSNSPPTICRQMRIESDLSARPNLNSDGKPIVIEIAEIAQRQGPPPSSKRRSGEDDEREHQRRDHDEHENRRREPSEGMYSSYPPDLRSHLFPRDSADYSDCGCLWFMT